MILNANLPSPSARMYAAALIVAPVLLLASTVGYAVAGEGVNHGVLGGVLGVWSVFALLLALLGLLRLLEPAAPRTVAVLTVPVVTGFAGGVAFNVAAIFDATIPAAPDVAFDAVVDASPGALLAFLPWGWFAPLSMVLVGVALWRTGVVARWSAASLVAGGVLFVASRPERIDWLAMIGDGVLILALAPIGLALLTAAKKQTVATHRQPAHSSTP